MWGCRSVLVGDDDAEAFAGGRRNDLQHDIFVWRMDRREGRVKRVNDMASKTMDFLSQLNVCISICIISSQNFQIQNYLIFYMFAVYKVNILN